MKAGKQKRLAKQAFFVFLFSEAMGLSPLFITCLAEESNASMASLD